MTTQAITATISPLADTETHNANYDPGLEDLNLNNALFAMTFPELILPGKETYSQSNKEAELYAKNIEEQKQAMENIKQQALCFDTKEAEEYLARHGMHPNHLFGTDLETSTKEGRKTVLDLSGNSPEEEDQERSSRSISDEQLIHH
jgi:hypothetical protein